MSKTFDRYVLSRFLSLFAGFFAASLGLFAVVDGFLNLDDFQKATEGQGVWSMASFMGRHYVYQTAWVFDLIGPTLLSISVVTLLALLIRHGEVNPLLAAGIPTYRLALPIFVGTALVHGVLLANKELLLPKIAAHLTGSHGHSANDGRRVEPQSDRVNNIFISGRELIPASRAIRDAEFRLASPTLVREFTPLRAEEATYWPADGLEPAGWLLKGVVPGFDALDLTERGMQQVFRQRAADELFVATEVSWDLLYSGGTAFTLLSTPDLISRVQRPTTGTPLLRAQLLHLHSRFTRPLLNIIGIFLAIPLVVRRESRSLVTSVALCMSMLAAVIGLSEVFQYIGKAALMGPALATWSPLMIGGGLAAWVSHRVQT